MTSEDFSQPETLIVSDGTDSATLSAIRDGWKIELDVPDEKDENKKRLLEAAAQAIAIDEGGRLEYWIEGVEISDDLVPIAAGYTPYRDLWRLSRPLPTDQSQLVTRSFTSTDLPEIVSINNRAFSWHPERSDLTIDDFEKTMEEPWFNSNGLRIWELNGTIQGFCWTKIHHDLSPIQGEIYVVAVDPDLQGGGTGTQLVLAGLNWLHVNDINQAMLYVESNNAAANHVYNALGFEHEVTNRAYERFIR
ncbi:MAG TPA: GNAT family N-acetyltransferase [Acidimicrobiales bacterium]|nr:GNAT family N-acetyltransferase [Acidimicrobiales bacterium]|tara:strand:- start:236 stop:982 length:747 start_codon:yes stop_codon:yes gene_type:complete